MPLKGTDMNGTQSSTFSVWKILVMAMLMFGLAACEQANDAAEATADAVQDAGEATGDAIEEGYDATAEAAEDGYDATADEVEKAAE
jgi:hypothetical protein